MPPFSDGMCCRNPENLNVSGSIDAANREVLICCCGCKQLIRKSARCLLTGRDSRDAAGGGERATSPSLSLRSLLFLLCCHLLLSHQGLPGEAWGPELGLPRTILSLLNAISPPPVARLRLISPFFHPVFLASASL